jgi:two-component system response regulator
MADDDADDRRLTREAWEASKLLTPLYCVEDGEELLEFLRREGRYRSREPAHRTGLVLLDLNMPRMDGREALRVIKGDPLLRTIPTVVLTTSSAQEDVAQSYSLGANSFVTKPVTFDGLVKVVCALGMYWFEIVKLPSDQLVTIDL